MNNFQKYFLICVVTLCTGCAELIAVDLAVNAVRFVAENANDRSYSSDNAKQPTPLGLSTSTPTNSCNIPVANLSQSELCNNYWVVNDNSCFLPIVAEAKIRKFDLYSPSCRTGFNSKPEILIAQAPGANACSQVVSTLSQSDLCKSYWLNKDQCWDSVANEAFKRRIDLYAPSCKSNLQSADPVIKINNGEKNRLASDLAEALKKQKELEEQLVAAQMKPISSEPSPQKQVGANIRSAHALVIGNAAYPGSNRLDNTINDANAISQKLRSLGFTVTTITDANRQRLVQAMAQFKKSAANADLSLLFYAGHGVQIFGTNYILPTDVDQNDVAQATIQGVSLNSVVENFLPGKTKLVFLDACRDNPLQRSGDRSVSKGLAPISVAQGTLISYATKDGQTASDGVGAKNSPFTQALLQHLDDPADIAVVLRKVREKVMQATGGKQQPWEYGSLTGGELVLSRIKESR
jgi:hypothetical protein